MVQTVCTRKVLAGKKIIILEKPLVLQRIFFSICAITNKDSWHEAKISFDDPDFRSFYVLDESARYFEATGEDIFQGDIWIWDVSDVDILFTATEILR